MPDQPAPTTPSPVVSVVMPVHHYASPYLEAALASLLEQTFEHFEIVVVDGQSQDASSRKSEVLDACSERDPRVRVIHASEGGGTAESRNEGMAAARGEFIAVMDAHDASLPERLRAQVRYLQANPQCVALGSAFIYIDPDGDELRPQPVPVAQEAIDAALLGQAPLGLRHATAMFRRQALEEVGGYDPSYRDAHGRDLLLRLGEVGRLANLPDCLLHSRVRLPEQGDHLEAHAAHRRQAIEAACARRGIDVPPIVEPSRHQPESVADHHRRWAHWAMMGGNPAAARIHAVRALRHDPWSGSNWRIFWNILLMRTPKVKHL